MKLTVVLSILALPMLAHAADEPAPESAPEKTPVETHAPVPPRPAPVESWQPKPLAFDPSPQVRVDVLMVEVPQPQALRLLPLLRDPKRASGGQDAVLALVEKGQAQLLDWPEVTLHSGGRSVSETIVEERYPIEFGLAFDSGGKPIDAKPAPSLAVSDAMTPSVFETRNAGATIEVEAVISPDLKSVTMQMAPQLVKLVEMRPFEPGKTADGKAITITQPVFRTMKVNTTLTLDDGERRLIYCGRPLRPDSGIVLFIAGVSIIPGHK